MPSRGRSNLAARTRRPRRLEPMALATDEVLKALADPSLWDVGPEANVFDEHVETGADGTQEVFDKPRLDRLAANSNARDRIGQPCPMTLGHTRDGVAETEQPPIVGYWRNFRVVWDARLAKWVVRALPYVRRDQAETARQYPRVSVERWPGADFFDPIAILKVTPRQDLGQWTYQRPGGKIRYSMEHAPMADTPKPATPPAAPATPPPPAGGEHEEYARVKGHVHRYMAECYPHLHAMHASYAASLAPPGPAGGPPAVPAPDPTKPPVARPEVERMQADSLAIKYARLEQEIAAERKARVEAESERCIVQLEAEGYRFPDLPGKPGSGRAREVQRLAGLTPEGRVERMEEVRLCYQRSPVPTGFVQLAPVQEGGGQPKAMTREQFAEARKYQRAQQAAGKAVRWEEAVEHVVGARAG